MDKRLELTPDIDLQSCSDTPISSQLSIDEDDDLSSIQPPSQLITKPIKISAKKRKNIICFLYQIKCFIIKNKACDVGSIYDAFKSMMCYILSNYKNDLWIEKVLIYINEKFDVNITKYDILINSKIKKKKNVSKIMIRNIVIACMVDHYDHNEYFECCKKKIKYKFPANTRVYSLCLYCIQFKCIRH